MSIVQCQLKMYVGVLSSVLMYLCAANRSQRIASTNVDDRWNCGPIKMFDEWIGTFGNVSIIYF